MDFSSAIQSKMRDVNDGSTEPFIIYRDNDGGWHCDHTQNQYGEKFDWVEEVKAQDPLALFYTGADFSKASFPSVYDTILCDRIRAEYYIARSSGKDDDNLHALVCYFNDNVSSFSHETTDYLTTLERPLAALQEMTPYNMATDYEGYEYNPSMTKDLADRIEHEVRDRLRTQTDKIAQEIQILDGYRELNKISINDSDVILSENPDAEYRYMVIENRYTQYYNDSGDNITYAGQTNDYLEAVSEFTKRVQYNADCVQSRRDSHQRMDGVDYIELKNNDCLPGSDREDFTGKLIIVKSSELKPEYRSSENQLVLCSHGNGARPNAIGTSVFGTELYTGATVCYGRHQIAGIADHDKLPVWAVKKLALMEALKAPGVFEYGGYHFKPHRTFEKRDGDFVKQMHNASSDHSLGITAYDWGKTEYSHALFYAASGDSETDIFRCIENGKLYIPCENELFRYNEPPQKTRAPQGKKPSLLGKLDDAKAEASARHMERKDAPKKKKHGLEV